MNSFRPASGITLLLLFMGIFFSFSLKETSIPPLRVKLKLVAQQLTSPVGMASPDDGTHRLFIIEQNGKIKIIKNGNLLPLPFLDISSKLDRLNFAYSEKGLLGIAFHPAYKTNRRFFVYYSAPSAERKTDHVSIVAEYKASITNPDVADTKEEVILRIPQPESNHNGGCLQFGKDGFLYIGLGDGGGAGDKHGTMGNAQNLDNWLGKILRIDVDRKPFAVPADNPFVKRSQVKPEIYAYGLRNPWRFSFDRSTGRLFCGDVGQDKWEEINIIEKGKNYGWRVMEASHCFNPRSGCKTENMVLPISEYSHDEGLSVCGGYVYRGKETSLQGIYFFADWSGKIFYLKPVNRGWQRGEVFVNGNESNDFKININSMGEDHNGEIYFITQGSMGPRSKTGSVYRMSL